MVSRSSLVVLRFVVSSKSSHGASGTFARELLPSTILRVRKGNLDALRQNAEIGRDDRERVLVAIPADTTSATGTKKFLPSARL
jgi:hypothetical protein